MIAYFKDFNCDFNTECKLLGGICENGFLILFGGCLFLHPTDRFVERCKVTY